MSTKLSFFQKVAYAEKALALFEQVKTLDSDQDGQPDYQEDLADLKAIELAVHEHNGNDVVFHVERLINRSGHDFEVLAAKFAVK